MSTAGEADLSIIGRLVAEPARARALMALADGRCLPASMLALEAGVANSTMSGHLARLLDGHMITVQRQGRYRYYQLAGPHIAELVEVMARVAPTLTINSLKAGTRAHAIRRARRCYDHLAGRLAVAITTALVRDRHLTGPDDTVDPDGAPGHGPAAYTLTEEGAAFLAGRLDVDASPHTAVRCCVDWTERRHHIAGTLGRDLLAKFQDNGWLKPAPQPRALLLSAAGRTALEKAFRTNLPRSTYD